MFTLAHFFYGIVIIALGVAGLKYNYQIVNYTGRQDWIEDKLGGGSTFLAYKLFAFLAVIVGILLAFGLINPVLETIFSPLKSAFPIQK
jgi:hypothetical protein